LQIAWVGDGKQAVFQLADNLREIQLATGKKILEVYGTASAGFETAIREEKFNHELYARTLSRRLGGEWKVETPLKPGFESMPIKHRSFEIKVTRIGD
jgi:hypothetical protein